MERDETRAERQVAAAEPVFVVLERDPLVAEDIMGSLTAMVFGVTSPRRSNSGNMTRTLIHPARSSPYR